MLLCWGVPLLNGDLEGSDARGLRKFGVDREEGVIGLRLEVSKVAHPRDLHRSETTRKTPLWLWLWSDSVKLFMTNISVHVSSKQIEAGLRMGLEKNIGSLINIWCQSLSFCSLIQNQDGTTQSVPIRPLAAQLARLCKTNSSF